MAAGEDPTRIHSSVRETKVEAEATENTSWSRPICAEQHLCRWGIPANNHPEWTLEQLNGCSASPPSGSPILSHVYSEGCTTKERERPPMPVSIASVHLNEIVVLVPQVNGDERGF